MAGITVRNLIKKLRELDPSWEVDGEAIKTYQPDFEWRKGERYGYVFPYDKSNKILTVRKG